MNTDNVMILRPDFSVFGKQGNGSWRFTSVFQYLNRAPPGFLLTVVDLAKIEHLFLCNTLFANAMILYYAPITVLFAVFLPFVHS